jgi:hypothetical protein
MSAQQSAELVHQIVDALAPHPVVVHHDFSKRADFVLDRDRAHLVPDPRQTGWGTWGFCEALLHGMQFCVDHFDFDYLQLLSPTCLPVRPLAEFEAHVIGDPSDAHADLIDIAEDIDAWMTYAWRAHFPSRSIRQRLAATMATWYFGKRSGRSSRSSLEVLVPPVPGSLAWASLRQRAAVGLTGLLVSGPARGCVYGDGFRPFVGSTWFGARPAVVEYLLEQSRCDRIREFFGGLANTDEHLFPTLLGNSPFAIGDSNHWISSFDEIGHPAFIVASDLSDIARSRRFFARKFADDPDDPVRRRALALVGAGQRSGARHGVSPSLAGAIAD